MKTEQKIIKLFLQKKESRTIREIAKGIKADYKITHLAVQRLSEKNIILKQEVGHSSLCKLNENSCSWEILTAEEERKKELLKNKNIAQVFKEIMKKVDTLSFVLLIFGSYAKATNTKDSDIDLLFITNKKNFEERIQDIISLLPLRIHMLVFTEEEFIRMKDAKKPNVVKEAIKNNIPLWATQVYYGIKNA